MIHASVFLSLARQQIYVPVHEKHTHPTNSVIIALTSSIVLHALILFFISSEHLQKDIVDAWLDTCTTLQSNIILVYNEATSDLSLTITG